MMIGYARCSTSDQNPQLQSDALAAAGCNKIFVDHASGVDRMRPELAKALAYCRKGDVFCAWKIDRVARSVLHLTEIAEQLERNGVGFKILNDPIDTTTPAGMLTFHILGAMSQFERAIIRERTMAGLAAARARGRVGGRPRKVVSA